LRVVIITQDDPFYLPNAIPKLFEMIKGKHEIVGCFLLSASPFGKKESLILKSIKTFKIFGLHFFLRYLCLYVWRKIFSRQTMQKLFKKRDIPILKSEISINASQSLDWILAQKPDILVSIAGNEIFKNQLIKLAPKGCLNLHTAALPKYRGLMPSFWVLHNGESQTGISVFCVDEGIDSGPIVVQKFIEVGDTTLERLIQKTKLAGMEAIAEALDVMMRANPKFIENNNSKASYFSFPTANDVRAFRRSGAQFF